MPRSTGNIPPHIQGAAKDSVRANTVGLAQPDFLKYIRTALFCSARCPGSVILQLHETARRLGASGVTVVSGFHTPAEREVFAVLLRAGRSIRVPARTLPKRLTAAERAAMDEGRLAIVSPFPEGPTQQSRGLARRRNEHVLSMVDRVFVLHASPGGETERIARLAVEQGKPLATLDDPANAHLVALDAIPVMPADVGGRWGVDGREASP